MFFDVSFVFNIIMYSSRRQKWAATLRNLLDSSYIIDFIDAHSIDGTRSKSRGSTFTWSTLFKSLVGYVSREVEALVKLSDKPTQTTSAYSSRQTKKKVESVGGASSHRQFLE